MVAARGFRTAARFIEMACTRMVGGSRSRMGFARAAEQAGVQTGGTGGVLPNVTETGLVGRPADGVHDRLVGGGLALGANEGVAQPENSARGVRSPNAL